jgi:hypothetical protein
VTYYVCPVLQLQFHQAFYIIKSSVKCVSMGRGVARLAWLGCQRCDADAMCGQPEHAGPTQCICSAYRQYDMTWHGMTCRHEQMVSCLVFVFVMSCYAVDLCSLLTHSYSPNPTPSHPHPLHHILLHYLTYYYRTYCPYVVHDATQHTHVKRMEYLNRVVAPVVEAKGYKILNAFDLTAGKLLLRYYVTYYHALLPSVITYYLCACLCVSMYVCMYVCCVIYSHVPWLACD